MFKVSDESFEFWFLVQVFEMWIDPKERPAGESSVYAPLEPLHCLVRFAQYGVNACDLMVGVVSMTKEMWGIQRLANTP